MDHHGRSKSYAMQKNGASLGSDRKDGSKPKTPTRGAGDGPADNYQDKDRYADKRDKRGKPDRYDRKLSSGPPPSKVKESKSLTKAELERKKEEEERLQREEEERMKEEQRKKEEEEKARKEEEERRQKEEEEARVRKEETRQLQEFIDDIEQRKRFKAEMKEKNQAAGDNRPDEAFFSRLDSSLKKNTAFVKKLRTMTESQRDSLIKEFGGLNLTKYIGEVTAAIAEAKLKMSDIQMAVQICSLLHQRYADFSSSLLDNMQKFLLTKTDRKINNPSKYRVDLRFLGELISVGVFTSKEGLPVLANQLSVLVNSDQEEHNHLNIISSFCKHLGDDYVGLVPRRFRVLSEKYGIDLPRSQMLPPERQKACRNLLKDYYTSLCRHLTRSHKDLKAAERQNRRILQTKGELSNERQEMCEAMVTGYQKLYASTATFADLLDENMPDLPEDDFKNENNGMFDIFNPTEFQYEGDTTLFEDDDMRSFYETLPDLRAFIPGILYKDSEQKDGVKNSEQGYEEDMETIEVEDLEREIETEQQIAEEEEKILEEKGEKVETPSEPPEPEAVEDTGFQAPEADEEDGETGSLMRSQFELFLQSLPNCVNRDLIDKAAIEFCMNFNTKSNRKKLVRALFSVHRTRYDLLPFYARLIAILNPCMPDLATELMTYLKGDFKWHVRKKDQINIESKLKIVRFIGELVKFKMCPKAESLQCIKMLMFDFTHHNIEMACSLLETCGRFLYRSPDSHHRTKVYLDVMMRKKAALHLDGRYQTMIENAYFYCNPPEVQQAASKQRPPLHTYIRKLLYKDLSKITTEKILRQMRKLDWDNTEVAFYTTKCLIGVWNVRYNSIHCAANVLAGLAPYHEHVAIQVVDGVLEDIRLGMEVNHPKYNQRRVSCVKYLGELYNYRMVESSVIFKTLYSLITFGVTQDVVMVPADAVSSGLDPPEHLFRIRLTCVLLETCGQYFSKGSSKKKLDCFLVYFQRYYWFKKKNPVWNENHPFPVDVENLVIDTLEIVRPKLKMFENYEDCCKAAEQLELEYKNKLASVMPIVDTDDAESVTDGDGLAPIQESEEFFQSDELSQGVRGMSLDERLSETSQGSEHSPSQTGSHSTEDLENMGSSSCGDDDLMESAGEDETEDQMTVLKGRPKHIQCQEDEDFMSAFDKMIAENIQARTQESLKVPQLDIAVPMHLMGKTKKVTQTSGTGVTMAPQSPPEENGALTFVLMTKRGNKQQFTNLKVPISEEFAAKFQERKEAERIEKEKMKQVVLGIHERQEEEDYQEMIAALNRPMPMNTNRERRVRYQHPKGAPDADLIFGSKKR